MALTSPIFTFPNHLVEEKYPTSGINITLGDSYEYSSAPNGPDQRIFTLYFQSMWRGLDTSGAIDLVTAPENNAGLLQAFYLLHKLWSTFQYPHPWLGTLNVRFSQPLAIPKGLIGGGGWTEAFSVEFKEQP